MDIGSNGKYPGCALSNFAAHEFTLDTELYRPVTEMGKNGFMWDLSNN